VANPKILLSILKEKCEHLKTVQEKEIKFKRKAKLKLALIDSNQKLMKMRQRLSSANKPKLFNFLNLIFFSKKKTL